MVKTATLLSTAAKMYEARDTVKLLLGPEFRERMENLAGPIKERMAELGCDTIPAAFSIIKGLQAMPQDTSPTQLQVLAAAVEMVEPSDN